MGTGELNAGRGGTLQMTSIPNCHVIHLHVNTCTNIGFSLKSEVEEEYENT